MCVIAQLYKNLLFDTTPLRTIGTTGILRLMSDLEKHLASLPPEAYDCTHPERAKKAFCPEKVNKICLTVNNGKPCPFLTLIDARDGRESDRPLFIRPTRRSTKRFPGE